MSGVGDANRDGVPDLVVGAVSSSASSAHVFSGRRLPLVTDVHELRVRTGGSQRFELDAGAVNAGRLYLLLGTYHGTKPGLRLGGVTLPLNFDEYLTLTLSEANRLILGSFAVLDAKGRASAKLVLPPLPAYLAGTLLHHAFVAFRPSPLRFDLASNPVPLTLVK